MASEGNWETQVDIVRAEVAGVQEKWQLDVSRHKEEVAALQRQVLYDNIAYIMPVLWAAAAPAPFYWH